MIQAITMFLTIATGFLTGASVFGHEAVYRLAYGALTLMAAMISLTFLWLWARRATPLALGMSFSWAGAASVLGWWWVYRLLDQPRAMLENQAIEPGVRVVGDVHRHQHGPRRIPRLSRLREQDRNRRLSHQAPVSRGSHPIS